MSEEIPTGNGTEEQEAQEGANRGLITAVIVMTVVVIVLLILWFSGVFSGGGQEVETTVPGEANITILIPPDGSVLDITKPVTVSGVGSGLFEGNVVVQALDDGGNVLAEGATTIDSPEAGTGGVGPWQIELNVEIEPGNSGSIRAFSTSPADGSVIAEDIVQVAYGEEAAAESFIKIGSPADGSVVDISVPITVEGAGGGLYEGSLVVQVLDQQENVLAEQAATIDSPDAGIGGTGSWRVELSVATDPGTTGRIRAFSTSPEGDDIVAKDSVQVQMGETPKVEAYIEIEEPADGATVDTVNLVIVRGIGAGLFEGNVVVQALDGQGNVLAEQPTIIQSPDAGIGGEGPWQVELDIEVEPGTPGTIRAFSPSPVEGEGVMAEDSVSVTYEKAEEPDEEVKLEDHLWLLMTYSGKQVLEGTMITAEFKDGQVAGKSGCNNYFTSYETNNGNVTITEPVGLTQMFCQDPEGVMEQEGEYLGVLVQSTTYQIKDGKLEISDSSGNLILVYEAAVVGNITAREGSALPEGAAVQITLSDVSLQDVAAKVIGEQVIQNPGQFPFPYAVTYDPEIIDPRNTYAMGVRITDSDGNLIYINTSAYNVITGGNPSQVDVMVEPV